MIVKDLSASCLESVNSMVVKCTICCIINPNSYLKKDCFDWTILFLINNWTSLMTILMSHTTFKHEFSKNKMSRCKTLLIVLPNIYDQKVIMHLDIEPC